MNTTNKSFSTAGSTMMIAAAMFVAPANAASANAASVTPAPAAKAAGSSKPSTAKAAPPAAFRHNALDDATIAAWKRLIKSTDVAPMVA